MRKPKEKLEHRISVVDGISAHDAMKEFDRVKPYLPVLENLKTMIENRKKNIVPKKDKMIIKYTLCPITWAGDSYQLANAEIDYCCEDAKKLEFQKTNVPRNQDPKNFLKVLYEGNPVENCPFCGARIEVEGI